MHNARNCGILPNLDIFAPTCAARARHNGIIITVVVARADAEEEEDEEEGEGEEEDEEEEDEEELAIDQWTWISKRVSSPQSLVMDEFG